MAQFLIEEAIEYHLDELERQAREQAQVRAELRRKTEAAQASLETSRQRR